MYVCICDASTGGMHISLSCAPTSEHRHTRARAHTHTRTHRGRVPMWPLLIILPIHLQWCSLLFFPHQFPSNHAPPSSSYQFHSVRDLPSAFLLFSFLFFVLVLYPFRPSILFLSRPSSYSLLPVLVLVPSPAPQMHGWISSEMRGYSPTL